PGRLTFFGNLLSKRRAQPRINAKNANRMQLVSIGAIRDQVFPLTTTGRHPDPATRSACHPPVGLPARDTAVPSRESVFPGGFALCPLRKPETALLQHGLKPDM